jgi:hypothetical protein
MSWGRFDAVTLLPGDAGLEVRGTYDPNIIPPQQVVGDAFIGFLIIQQDEDNNPTRIVDGVTNWTYSAPVNGKYHQWVGIVEGAKVRAAGITPGNARAIGTAVQIKVYNPANRHDPPGVEMFNWCVDQVVAGP